MTAAGEVVPAADVTHEQLQSIQANVEIARRTLTNVYGETGDFDLRNLQVLDEFVESRRDGMLATLKEPLVETMGSFLGQAIISEYGGRWVVTEVGTGVQVVPGLVVYPYNKARKSIFEGDGEAMAPLFVFVGQQLGEISGNDMPDRGGGDD